jgi:hypothetical protein
MKGESFMSKPNVEGEAAVAKKDGETEEKKSKKKTEEEVRGKESDSKKPDEDDEEDDPDDDEPEDEKKEGKKSKTKASGQFLSVAGEPLQGMRSESDIQAISALCKMAGQPEKAAEFLTNKSAKGQYFSVAEVSEALTSARVAESERHMINSNVNPNAGSGGVQELEAQAVAFSRQNRGQVTPGMYVVGTATKITKERAYAAMLEEHPEAYEQFRSRHNAKGLIATLEAAGIRLAR